MNQRTHHSRPAAYVTLLLLVLCAVLLAWLTHRFTLEADWTHAGRHTLTSASIELLGHLDGALEITAYAREEPALRDLVRHFVGRYQRHKPDIKLDFVNPDLVPDEVRSLGITVDGELIVRYQDRLEHVRTDSEQEFANALQRLLRPGERWLAFTEGHGERSAVGKANHDLGLWAEQLRQRGYRFQPVNLAATQAIPDNTAVLIIGGPRMPFLPGELQIIQRYLERGGNLLWLVDPGQAPPEPLSALLDVEIPAGTVIDTAGRLLGISDPTFAVITASLYGTHPALRGFTLTSLLPGAGALQTAPQSGWNWTPLLTTGSHTWLETSALSGEVQPDPGVDPAGPLTLAASLTRPRPGAGTERAGEQRIIVVADGDFLSNTYISNGANLELGLRLMSWLSQDEDLVSIPPRTAGDMHLEMSPVLLGALGLYFFIALPLFLLGAGISVWWRRSRL